MRHPRTGCAIQEDEERIVIPRLASHEEEEFLRPTFDGGTFHFIGLFTEWDESTQSPHRERLGTLLLTPAANSDTLEDYAHYLWDVGDIAFGMSEILKGWKAPCCR